MKNENTKFTKKKVNTKSKEMDIVFLLDKSGSMYGSENDTIGGYNSFLDEQIKNNINAKITTILFDHSYTELLYRKDIKEVNHLTNSDYVPGGSTALLDAIGFTIDKIKKDTDGKVLFIITTDGQENASMEYNNKQIKRLINDQKNWEFLYLGANIDSFSEGGSIGISRKNIANYEKSSGGIRNLFNSVSKAAKCLYSEESLDESWKDELNGFINNNINK